MLRYPGIITRTMAGGLDGSILYIGSNVPDSFVTVSKQFLMKRDRS